MLDKSLFTSAVADFIEEMGILSQADDLPRIAGRITGLLAVAELPLSFSDIALSLDISRASVSTNARLLVEIGVIERVALPGQRQDYYRVTPHCHLLVLRRIIGRMERLNEAVAAAMASLPDDKPGVKERLSGLGQFYSSVTKSLTGLSAEYDPRSAQQGQSK